MGRLTCSERSISQTYGLPASKRPAVNWKPNEPRRDGGREPAVPSREVIREKDKEEEMK